MSKDFDFKYSTLKDTITELIEIDRMRYAQSVVKEQKSSIGSNKSREVVKTSNVTSKCEELKSSSSKRIESHQKLSEYVDIKAQSNQIARNSNLPEGTLKLIKIK